MKALNLTNVQEAGTSERLPAGGYVCKYTSVVDVADKEYLYMEFDIAEGEHRGYYARLEERAGYWAMKCYRSYKEKALPMFKRMCTAVSKSNAGFVFDGGQVNADEKTLVGKLVGIVLGEEEYERQDGNIGTRLYVSYECAADKIRKGEFKVPEKKTLVVPPYQQTATPTPSNDFISVPAGTDDEIPFN